MSQACKQAHFFEQIPAYLRCLFDGQARRRLGPAESVQLLCGHPAWVHRHTYTEFVRHTRNGATPPRIFLAHASLGTQRALRFCKVRITLLCPWTFKRSSVGFRGFNMRSHK